MLMQRRIWAVYAGGFLLAVHYASVAYVNSSLLSKFAGDSLVSLLYVGGSILSLILLGLAPFMLRKFGNIATLLLFVGLEIIAVFGMRSATLALLVFVLFLIHQAAESMLYFSLDVSLEHETQSEGSTGSKRGVFLTVQNIAWVLSPLALAALTKGANFGNAYLLSGIALIPLFIIGLFILRRAGDSRTHTAHLLPAIKSLRGNWDKARIIGTQFVLQFYFSWMIIYLPLLLNQDLGFGWDKIGIIFTIMLLPYLLFEFPTGLLADKKIGEKEFLIFGFLIMVVATAVIPLIESPTLWIWAGLLFITRIGASMVEIASETYFFRQVKDRDTGLISLFRMARPLSFILAPLIAIPVLYFTSYGTSFLILAVLTLSGLLFIPKKDTR